MSPPASPQGSERDATPPDRSADRERDRVHEQVRALAAGGVVEIDAADRPVRLVSLLTGLDRLAGPDGAGGRPAAASLTLREPAEFLDYFPHLSAAAARTVARWWPGPVAVEVDARPGGLADALPDPAGAAAAPTRVTCSNEPAVAAALELCPAPLVRLDAAPAETVVRLNADGAWEVIEEGALTAADLTERQGETIVFVCTGNTCRSPLAEALLRRRAASIGGPALRVLSAGLSAGYGSAASPESVDLAREAGADLTDHRSQPLTEELLDGADRVLCMTARHRAAILRHRPDVRDRVTLLDPAGGDIPDPIGGGMADYEACRDAIERGLEALMIEFGAVQPGGEPPPGET